MAAVAQVVIPFSEFLSSIGRIQVEQRAFIKNGGGAPDDSLRGFGAIEQWWSAPTTNGWRVTYVDVSSRIDSATSPEGERYVRSSRLDTASSLRKNEAIRRQDVMRSAGQTRIKSMTVEYQSGHYTGSISRIDLYSEEEEREAIAFACANDLAYHLEE